MTRLAQCQRCLNSAAPPRPYNLVKENNMCGIVGAVAERDVAAILLEGLRRLEYRGYDSAGAAVINTAGELHRRRRVGKVQELADAVTAEPLPGHIGIAHTRWATHGVPSEANAHPHQSDRVAVVHNGIIENHEPLRRELQEQGYSFTSETDTEVVAHLTHSYLTAGQPLEQAVRSVIDRLEGAYALAVIDRNDPEVLFTARKGSPLVIGVGIGEHFVASDVAALLPVTREFIFLEEGDFALVRRDSLEIFDEAGKSVSRPQSTSELTANATSRGEYRHFMLKEIHEQPAVIAETLEGRISDNKVLEQSFGPKATELFAQVENVHIIACGTSYHSGMVARYWIESLAKVPCMVEIASEFRYRSPVVPKNTLFVTISQSGETADTLAALRESKRLGYLGSLAICNVPESSLVRESDTVLMTRAGPEIGVASTKAFTTQLVTLALFAITLGRKKGLNAEQEADYVQQLRSLPRAIEDVLKQEADIEKLSEAFADKHHALFLGRGAMFPIALEGALKLKEISYIHAEAYAAGELKHGPLALVDDDMPVVSVAPNDSLLEKLKSNLEEVRARGGKLFVFADGAAGMKNIDGMTVLPVPAAGEIAAPIIYIVPLQLLSYHVAVLKGTDVDQPRNLAKSVTVE